MLFIACFCCCLFIFCSDFRWKSTCTQTHTDRIASFLFHLNKSLQKMVTTSRRPPRACLPACLPFLHSRFRSFLFLSEARSSFSNNLSAVSTYITYSTYLYMQQTRDRLNSITSIRISIHRFVAKQIFRCVTYEELIAHVSFRSLLASLPELNKTRSNY